MASNDSGGAAPQPQKPVMHMNPRIEADRQMILDARAKGKGALFGAFVKLSGPGWLQSGITLGGGSLSSSLYLGVLVGFSFMWLQPLAMILGIIMMSAIAYVTLSTGERPLRGHQPARQSGPGLGLAAGLDDGQPRLVATAIRLGHRGDSSEPPARPHWSRRHAGNAKQDDCRSGLPRAGLDGDSDLQRRGQGRQSF